MPPTTTAATTTRQATSAVASSKRPRMIVAAASGSVGETIAAGTRRLPTAARNERVTGPGDRAHRREHQPNYAEGERAGSSGCESWSEVRVQGSHLPAGAIGFPSRSACVAARRGREAGGVKHLKHGRWTAQGSW